MLVVDFINVGYGDAVLLREIRYGRCVYAMLVDCGDQTVPVLPDTRRGTAAQFLRREGVRTLDLLVLTHLHLDHCGGLEEILGSVLVREFWTNHLPPRTHWAKQIRNRQAMPPSVQNLCASYDLFLRCLVRMEAAGTLIRLMRQNSPELPFGTGRLRGRIYCPDPALCRQQDQVWLDALLGGAAPKPLEALDSFINDTSIRLRLTFDRHAVELPGDLGPAHWQASGAETCTLLKLPHHGHRGCITPELARSLSPDYAVICVSNDRRDDCPSGEVRELMAQYTENVLYTDALPGPSGEATAHSAVRFLLGKDTVNCEHYCHDLIKNAR